MAVSRIDHRGEGGGKKEASKRRPEDVASSQLSRTWSRRETRLIDIDVNMCVSPERIVHLLVSGKKKARGGKGKIGRWRAWRGCVFACLLIY